MAVERDNETKNASGTQWEEICLQAIVMQNGRPASETHDDRQRTAAA
jgi:hypothetical protein